tara:strand:+ start:280 stop:1200 length:921 start_codon:yes stop_codon:yes gene_type:complete
VKSILITGANSFLSTNFVSTFYSNYNFFCIGHKKKIKNIKSKKNIKFIYTDLSLKKNFNKLPKKIDTIIHLAAIPNTFLIKRLGRDQIIKNSKITENIILYSNKIKCKKIIFFSSVYVYSGNKNKVFSEKLKLAPIENLGKSKVQCERLLRKNVNFRTKVIVFRLFTAFGKNSRPTQFLNILYNNLKLKKKIILDNDNVKRDYIYIKDIVDIIHKAIEKLDIEKNFDIFNLASGISVSTNQLVNILKGILSSNCQIIYRYNKKNRIKKKVGDIDHIANIKKIKKFFNWKPKYTVTKGLNDLYKKKR